MCVSVLSVAAAQGLYGLPLVLHMLRCTVKPLRTFVGITALLHGFGICFRRRWSLGFDSTFFWSPYAQRWCNVCHLQFASRGSVHANGSNTCWDLGHRLVWGEMATNIKWYSWGQLMAVMSWARYVNGQHVWYWSDCYIKKPSGWKQGENRVKVGWKVTDLSVFTQFSPMFSPCVHPDGFDFKYSNSTNVRLMTFQLQSICVFISDADW